MIRIGKNINDWKLSFQGKEKDNAEDFLAKLDACYKFSKAPDDIWLEAIARVFENKAGRWFRTNQEEFHSWKKFKKLFKEHYFGLLDEDDLFDELKMKVQDKNETIDEYIDGFRYIASRLRYPPSVREQTKMIYKNLRCEYRDSMKGCRHETFAEILNLGRQHEKENKLNERQAVLLDRKSGKVAALDEISASEKRKSKNKSAQKSKSKEQETVELEVAAIEGNKAQISMRPTKKQGVRPTSIPYNYGARQNLQQAQPHPRQNVKDQLVNQQLQENLSGWNRKQPQDDPQPGMQQTMQTDDRECFCCHEVGHIASRCPTLTCYNCGE